MGSLQTGSAVSVQGAAGSESLCSHFVHISTVSPGYTYFSQISYETSAVTCVKGFNQP